MRWAAHDFALWNPGDRDVRPTNAYVTKAVEAILRGTVADFLSAYGKPRKGFGAPPRGPVAVVGVGEWGDQKAVTDMLVRRGFGASFGDPRKYPHGAKEGFFWNPELVEPAGEHQVVRLAPANPKGKRSGRKGFVDMPPKYLHLRDFRNLATGAVITHWMIHYSPSVNLNAEMVGRAARNHAAVLAGETGLILGGGDFNMEAKHKLARDLAAVPGWVNSQEVFGEIPTFRRPGGKDVSIDWAMWREDPNYRAVRQLAIDMPGEERGKGGEHYAVVIEGDVRA